MFCTGSFTDAFPLEAPYLIKSMNHGLVLVFPANKFQLTKYTNIIHTRVYTKRQWLYS